MIESTYSHATVFATWILSISDISYDYNVIVNVLLINPFTWYTILYNGSNNYYTILRLS